MSRAVFVPIAICVAACPAFAEPPEEPHQLDNPAYSEPAEKWENVYEVVADVSRPGDEQETCNDEFQHTKTQSDQSATLIREASTPDDAMFVYAVDISEGSCKKMLVREIVPTIQPLPKPDDATPCKIPIAGESNDSSASN